MSCAFHMPFICLSRAFHTPVMCLPCAVHVPSQCHSVAQALSQAPVYVPSLQTAHAITSATCICSPSSGVYRKHTSLVYPHVFKGVPRACRQCVSSFAIASRPTGLFRICGTACVASLDESDFSPHVTVVTQSSTQLAVLYAKSTLGTAFTVAACLRKLYETTTLQNNPQFLSVKHSSSLFFFKYNSLLFLLQIQLFTLCLT